MAHNPGVLGQTLLALLGELEAKLACDIVSSIGPITFGVDTKVRDAIEQLPRRREKLGVVLHTGGGLVEVAERIVNVTRHFYREVVFIIPDMALSAGTVLAMSGDAIMMDYYSCLGPIDPQVEKEKRLVPALSYVIQFQRLIEKANAGKLTDADVALLSTFNLAELHQFEEARALSIDLLQKWLTTYKFKDWKETETSRTPVTPEMREARAKQIAEKLSDNVHWHSHGRGIPMKDLRSELNLRIDDFGSDAALTTSIRRYFELALDFMTNGKIAQLVHSRAYL